MFLLGNSLFFVFFYPWISKCDKYVYNARPAGENWECQKLKSSEIEENNLRFLRFSIDNQKSYFFSSFTKIPGVSEFPLLYQCTLNGKELWNRIVSQIIKICSVPLQILVSSFRSSIVKRRVIKLHTIWVVNWFTRGGGGVWG